MKLFVVTLCLLVAIVAGKPMTDELDAERMAAPGYQAALDALSESNSHPHYTTVYVDNLGAHWGELLHPHSTRDQACRSSGYFLERDCNARWPLLYQSNFANINTHSQHCRDNWDIFHGSVEQCMGHIYFK